MCSESSTAAAIGAEVPTERDDAETQALRNEVRTLKERIVVLERIATDSSHRLTDEIESLRDPTR